MPNIDFIQVINLIKLLKRVSNDKEVADILGMKSGAFSERKRKNSAPLARIEIFCNKEGLDYEEFLINCRKKNLKKNEYSEVLKKLEFIFQSGNERDEMEIRGRIYKLAEEIERRKKT